VFELASVGLALIFELAAPVGMSDMSGLDLLERLYQPVSHRAASARADRVAFVVAAGGQL
jgi:hypothetical protein